MDRREFDEMERDVATRVEALERARKRLERARAVCSHKWGETEYTPDHRDAYTIPGDPPGTMGSDWRGSIPVPAETTKKWTRQCELCGLTQITNRTKKQHVPGKVAGTFGQMDVPYFSDRMDSNCPT